MNTVELPKKWIEHCSNIPESGMGYTRVSVKHIFGNKELFEEGIVLNCSILETISKINSDDIVDIVLRIE